LPSRKLIKFSLDGLTVGKIKVTSDKLLFLNHQHFLRKLSTVEGTKTLVEQAMPFIADKVAAEYFHYLQPGLIIRELPSKDYLSAILKASQERMHTLNDLYDAGPYFFHDPDYSSEKLERFRQRHTQDLISMSAVPVSNNADRVVTTAGEKLELLATWEAKTISDSLKEAEDQMQESPKTIMQILRYALAGLEPGVGVPVIIEILGKDTTLRRLERARAYQIHA
jgi:glutamyl-tRNA synthetase